MAGTRKRHGVAPLLSLSPMLTLLVCPSVGANECPNERVQCSEGPVMKVSSCSTCALNGSPNMGSYIEGGESHKGPPCPCTATAPGECKIPSPLCKDADNGNPEKLLLWRLNNTQGQAGRTDLSCWLQDDKGVALSGPFTEYEIGAYLKGPKDGYHEHLVFIKDIVALDACPDSGATLFQINLYGANQHKGASCEEFDECELTLYGAPPPSLPPRAAAAPPPSPSPSPAGGSGDPHLHFAHGGRADFRGRDGARTQPLPFCAPRKRQSSSPPRVPSP